MNIKFDTESMNFLTIDNERASSLELEELFSTVMDKEKINAIEYFIKNRYLRAIQKVSGTYKKQTVEFEYHFLEKPAGINKVYCRGKDLKKKTLKIDMPYTVMIVKLLYLNGVYIKMGDKLFHSDTPIKKDFSNSLWEWGLSNVYEGTNHICWGHEKLPEIDIQNSYQYIDEFFLGINNNDLLRNKNINWEEMSPDIVHTLDIRTLKKLPYRLSSVINNNGF